MGAKMSGLGHALYDSKKKQFLGRDGAAWGKLGVFYFFFYIGLAGFFCAMLAVFMALSPRDQPRYYSHASSMRTRSNPLTPGLGFRPQPDVDRNLILVTKTASQSQVNSRARANDRDAGDENLPKEGDNPYVKSLKQYLGTYYGEEKVPKKKNNEEDSGENLKESAPTGDSTNNSPRFQINSPGACQARDDFGYTSGQPCVLIKMNKIVGFVPKPLARTVERRKNNSLECGSDEDKSSIPVHCYGENPADVDNIGPVTYYSEKGQTQRCGALSLQRFPYAGKYEREDRYQAPYVWVQFTAPKPNVLINVICRIYGQNIFFDKRTGRGLTRFQIFVEDSTKQQRFESARV